MKKSGCAIIAGLGVALGAVDFQVTFATGKWDIRDFIMVKGPRWKEFNRQWEQKSDHIVQKLDDQISDDDYMRRYPGAGYVAMCYKNPVLWSNKIFCSSRMSFDHRMAPIIVIASEFGRNAEFDAPEFRNHYEVCLFDEGINIWRHVWNGECTQWTLAGYIRMPFAAKTIYDLQLTLVRGNLGKRLEIVCGDAKFGCAAPDLPDELYLGIIGCEGRNRFYNFKLCTGK